MALPPPSFSGDALNFLTKFMGGQTAAKDLEPFSQWSDSQNGKTIAEFYMYSLHPSMFSVE